MKKILLVMCMFFLAATLLMAGGQTEEAEQPSAGEEGAATEQPAKPEKVIEVKMGHVEPSGSPLDQGWQFFADWVESTSGGRLKIDVYPAGQLGGMTELFESVKTGTLKISQGDEGAMASFYEPFLIASIPYLFPNEEVALRFYDSEFFQEKINDGLAEKTGVRIIGRGCYGFRCWTNNKREIRTPADFKGLKLRVMETPLFMKYVQALNAGPTPISFPELYSALQQGVVDGQENPVGVIWDQHFFEVQKYLTVDEHVAGVNSILVNEEWFQSLPEDLRHIIHTGARIASAIETGGRAFQNHVFVLDELRKEGMQIYIPTPAEKEAFKQASQQPVVDWLKGVVGDALVDEAFATVAAIQEEMKKEAAVAPGLAGKIKPIKADKVIEVKMGHVEPSGSPLDQGWQFFANWVEGASGGRFKIDVYPAGQLGGMTELFESVKTGTLKISQGDEGAMASFYEPFLIASVPYLFDNEEVALRFYDGDFFQDTINDGLAEKTGVRILGKGCYGFRCWTNNRREIRTPADFKGLKLRVMETPLFMKYVQALNAGPTPISFPELYSALQQGVVDGQENPVGVIWDQHFFEVQKYLTVDEHVAGVNSILVNEEWFQSLPEDLKMIIYTGAQIAGTIETGGRAYQNHVFVLDELRKEGMQIYMPTPAEKRAFKEASQQPVVDWLKGVIGDELVDKAFASVEAIEEEMKMSTKP